MNLFSQIFIIIALVLGMFPAAVATGIESCHNALQIIKTSFVFTLFKALLFSLGYLIGNYLLPAIPGSAFWIVTGIFLVLGLKMIFSSVRSDVLKRSYDVTNSRTFLLLAVALNMNDFIAGLAFGFTGAPLSVLLSIIVIAGLLITGGGIMYGRSRGNLIKASIAALSGGLVLTAYALFLFLQRTGGFI